MLVKRYFWKHDNFSEINVLKKKRLNIRGDCLKLFQLSEVCEHTCNSKCGDALKSYPLEKRGVNTLLKS